MWRVPGIFVVDKPRGPSSFGIVSAARRELGVKKIGHAGTLDPIASGVLVLGVGRGTRLLSLFSGMDKSYRAQMLLGQRTDTMDTTGTILDTRDAASISRGAFVAALDAFRGEIDQMPPMFSALKHGGRPLYKLAREGVDVERASRRIRIDRLEVLQFDNPRVVVEVDCSKGTYIRSLVDDLGRALGCGAVMSELVRTRVGPFRIEDACPPGQLRGRIRSPTVP